MTLRRPPALSGYLWVLLFAAGMLAFVACGVGAAACATAKPLGIGLVAAATLASFFAPDAGPREAEDEAPAREPVARA
jgi:hypothetical protein